MSAQAPSATWQSAGVPANSARRRPWAKWHYVYFLLAAFDVFTVCAGLQVTHSMMSIYSESVAVNQKWAERAFAYSRLGELAAVVNAPGNDIFISRDADAESTRLRASMWVFEQHFDKLREELRINLASADAQPLIARLDAVR